MSADPRVRDPQCIGPRLGGFARRPIRFNSIIIDRDIAGHTNGQLLDGVRLQLQTLGRVGGDPVGDVILPHRR